jgi:hypothetical protein
VLTGLVVIAAIFWQKQRSGRSWQDAIGDVTKVPEFFPKAVRTPPIEWKNQTLEGLTLNLPCRLTPVSPTHAKQESGNPKAPGIDSRRYEGAIPNGRVFFSHQVPNRNVRGYSPVSWPANPFSAKARELGVETLSANTVFTIVNGLRVRRSDGRYTKDGRAIRIRLAMFERMSDGWSLECHAVEDDPDGEGIFRRIAESATVR